jgi:hypothetical protein
MTAPTAGTVIADPRAHLDAPTPPPAQVRPGAWLAFCLLLPLLMSLPLGWYGAGIGSQMTRTASIILWVSVCWLSWWMSEACARGLGVALRPWDPAPWLPVLAGYWLNMALSSVYNPAVIDALLRAGLVQPTPMLGDYFSVERNLLDPQYLALLFAAGLPGLLFWLAGNYAFERMTGVPRLRRRPATFRTPSATPAPADNVAGASAGPPVTVHDGPAQPSLPALAAAPPSVDVDCAPPRFFRQLDRLAGLHTSELVAVEAEDHYIQVHSTRGRELIYYRFRDALEELRSVPGLQIHRSAWVSRQGVTELAGRGRNLQVVLVTGDRLKVSLSNRGALLQAGLKHR